MSSLSSVDTGSVKFIMDQTMTHDVCLMIACHQSVMTEERYETFTATLRSALQVFPPSHIFVCDNGRSYAPFDDTQWAAQQVIIIILWCVDDDDDDDDLQ